MSKVIHLLRVAALASGIAWTFAAVADGWEESAESRFLEKLNSPRDRQVVNDVRMWLEKATAQDLAPTSGPPKAIALLLQWQRTPKDEAEPLREFCGYLAGLYQIDVPHYWKRHLVAETVKVSGPPFKHDSGESRDDVGSRPGVSGNFVTSGRWTVFLDKGVKGTIENDWLLLEKGSLKLAFPDAKSTIQNRNLIFLVETTDPNRYYVLIQPDHGNGGRFVCWDGRGKLQWETTIWSSGHPGPMISNIYDEMKVVDNGEIVAVFGDARHCYCEIFAVDSGKCVARFSSSLWKDVSLKPER